MSEWYWKNGKKVISETTPIGSKKWTSGMMMIEEKLHDWKYRCVGRTRLWWGGRVSTVWIGLDMSWSFAKKHKPLFFETMVFKNGSFSELDMERYSTEDEAKLGHQQMVLRWSNPFFLLKELIYKVLHKYN